MKERRPFLAEDRVPLVLEREFWECAVLEALKVVPMVDNAVMIADNLTAEWRKRFTEGR